MVRSSCQPQLLQAAKAGRCSKPKLTTLQSLHLRYMRDLDWSLLAGVHNLCCLQLADCELAGCGPKLQVVSRFTDLTALCIEGGGRGPPATITAAEAGALKSSSQLAELTLSGQSAPLQLQDYASLLPPARQLQQLTRLHISADLLSNPAAVRQAGRC